ALLARLDPVLSRAVAGGAASRLATAVLWWRLAADARHPLYQRGFDPRQSHGDQCRLQHARTLERAGGLVAWALVRQHRTRTGGARAALATGWCIAAD